MPKTNGGVGVSEYTDIKQNHLNNILSVHFNIVSAIFKKHRENNWYEDAYWYFDIYAGSGIVKGKKGSPLIFLDIVAKNNLNANVVFIEHEKEPFEELKQNIFPYSYLKRKINLSCRYGNNKGVLPDYYAFSRKKRFGLLYADPNGVPDFDLLSKISQYGCYEKLDILINCPATAIKRCRNSKRCAYHTKTLEKNLADINKTHWLVREPYGQWQWTFLIGTNWDAFPKFKRLGFHRLETYEGQATLFDLNFTAKEKDI